MPDKVCYTGTPMAITTNTYISWSQTTLVLPVTSLFVLLPEEI